MYETNILKMVFFVRVVTYNDRLEVKGKAKHQINLCNQIGWKGQYLVRDVFFIYVIIYIDVVFGLVLFWITSNKLLFLYSQLQLSPIFKCCFLKHIYIYIKSIQLVSPLQTISHCLVFSLFTWWEYVFVFVCICSLLMWCQAQWWRYL